MLHLLKEWRRLPAIRLSVFQKKNQPHSVGSHSYCKGAQRTSVTLMENSFSLERERSSRLTNDGQLERLWLPHSVVRMWMMGGYTGLPLQDGVCMCSLPHQRHYSGKRISCSNLKFLGWKKKLYLQGLDETRYCSFSISSSTRWVKSWRKWRCTCIKFRCFDSASHNS